MRLDQKSAKFSVKMKKKQKIAHRDYIPARGGQTCKTNVKKFDYHQSKGKEANSREYKPSNKSNACHDTHRT